MRRTDIERDYVVKSGRIVASRSEHGLCRFEGEMLYVPFYWDLGLRGGVDDYDGDTRLFTVTKEDQLQFPELKDRRVVSLVELADGFVVEI